eukprot:344897-Lingulodinium_polyedra.AAC.1
MAAAMFVLAWGCWKEDIQARTPALEQRVVEGPQAPKGRHPLLDHLLADPLGPPSLGLALALRLGVHPLGSEEGHLLLQPLLGVKLGQALRGVPESEVEVPVDLGAGLGSSCPIGRLRRVRSHVSVAWKRRKTAQSCVIVRKTARSCVKLRKRACSTAPQNALSTAIAASNSAPRVLPLRPRPGGAARGPCPLQEHTGLSSRHPSWPPLWHLGPRSPHSLPPVLVHGLPAHLGDPPLPEPLHGHHELPSSGAHLALPHGAGQGRPEKGVDPPAPLHACGYWGNHQGIGAAGLPEGAALDVPSDPDQEALGHMVDPFACIEEEEGQEVGQGNHPLPTTYRHPGDQHAWVVPHCPGQQGCCSQEVCHNNVVVEHFDLLACMANFQGQAVGGIRGPLPTQVPHQPPSRHLVHHEVEQGPGPLLRDALQVRTPPTKEVEQARC